MRATRPRSSLTWFALICLLCLQALQVPPAAAGEHNVATVIAVRGEVTAIDRQGTTRQLDLKDPIYLEDTIDTGDKGRLQIMFSDNTIISLGRQTIIQMLDYRFDEHQKGSLSTRVNEGVFRVMGGILTKTSPENFTTNTASGNIGIRGSLYTGQIAGSELKVVFEGGKGITVQNDTGTVVITTPGHGIRANGFDQPISEPFKYTPADLSKLHNQLSVATEPRDDIRPGGKRPFEPPIHFNSSEAGSPPEPSAGADNNGEGPEVADAKQTTGEEVEEADPAAEDQKEGVLLEGLQPDDPVLHEIVSNVRGNQNEAAAILKNAVSTSGLSVETALSAVLSGMKNTTRDNFDRLMGEAMDMGMTVEQAKNVVSRYKASGGVCK